MQRANPPPTRHGRMNIMKHCNDCMGGAPARQGFFADAVIWRGETRGAEVQGRIIPSEILPDPSPSGLTLKRLTVMDECAEQADAKLVSRSRK